MYIADFQPINRTILTKCTKMTEEGHNRRHGMNGNAVDGSFTKEECSKTNYVQGGRLKFFKDGKFILELERAREGERVSWVSVPRKTFWPPQGTAASTPTYRQESSTSLSVSDDNSSIQSSPWQRDHSWKQTTPRPNLSKELTLYFWRPKSKRNLRKSNKRRRPYSTIADDEKNVLTIKKDVSVKCNKINDKIGSRLLNIVQNLIEKNFRTSTPPRTDMVVSPRKRFLREMEKDKQPIEDINCLKRSRNKSQTAPHTTSNTTTTSTSNSTNHNKINSPILVNGNAGSGPSTNEDVKPVRNCSYSITSLLAEDRNVKQRSPSNSPSHFSPVTQSQYCSPTNSSEDRWYSESVDRLRSIELSQVEKRTGYPSYHPHQSYMPTFVYPYHLPPYLSAYGRGYVVPPIYHSPLQIPIRQETPSCSWAVEPTARDIDSRDDTVTDMPLNLSKHAG